MKYCKSPEEQEAAIGDNWLKRIDTKFEEKDQKEYKASYDESVAYLKNHGIFTMYLDVFVKYIEEL